MRVRHLVCLGALVGLIVSLPSVVWAQAASSSSGIAGVVRDSTGAVLPGVTVEAESAVLIERVRTAVSDGDGRYNIVNLRPGSYTVAFSLPGFSTVKHENVELTAAFTATVNVDMKVGSLEETITVSGASPLVDIQNAQQRSVVSDELLERLPMSTITMSNIGSITPGMAGTINVGGASGVYRMSSVLNITFHGKSGSKAQFDGLRINSLEGLGDNTAFLVSPATVEEWTIDTGGATAESIATGLVVNYVPKQGGNRFSGMVSQVYSNDHLQFDNLTDEVRARGLQSVNGVLYVFSGDASVGGPIKRDKLWFFAAERWAGNKNRIAGLFFNNTHGSPFYTPDAARPAYRRDILHAHSANLTWQATSKSKVKFFSEFQDNCQCRGSGENIAPEAAYKLHFEPQALVYASWSSVRSNRLLLEARGGSAFDTWQTVQQPDVSPNDISITELSTGLVYNAGLGLVDGWGKDRPSVRFMERFALSYVTGSHSFKTGLQWDQGYNRRDASWNGDVSYLFLNGLPNTITQYGTPFVVRQRQNADLGVFVQDQWTVKRLSLNAGLRFDYYNAAVPEQHLDAGPFVGARDFAPVSDVPNWKDLNPRLGASLDLFGDGRTALKVSLGRYSGPQALDIAAANNPVISSVYKVTRTWSDSNGNYVPDCDLRNFSLNGECGPISDQAFGQQRITTTYDDDVLHGFGVRDYLWDVSAELHRELGGRVSLVGGYYRNWLGNFRVTDNLAVTPADYSSYCIAAPIDLRLPGGGGYEVCGLADVSPAKFGQVDNLVTSASRFGKQQRVSDFVTVSFKGGLGSDLEFGGGVDTGRMVIDNCYIVDSPQQLKYCRVVQPWGYNTQLKLNGSYSLPRDFSVSAVFQNTSGPAIAANYNAPNALIAPSLGRNLAACGTRPTCTASAVVPLLEPFTQFEPRRTQLDLRLAKVIRFGTMRLQAAVDVYNALNASPIVGVNTTYGARWLAPLGSPYVGGAILDGRLFQFTGRFTF